MYQQVWLSTTVRCAHTVFISFVFIWEQTANCATYSVNRLVFITEFKSVYCAVRTGSLIKISLRFVFKGLNTIFSALITASNYPRLSWTTSVQSVKQTHTFHFIFKFPSTHVSLTQPFSFWFSKQHFMQALPHLRNNQLRKFLLRKIEEITQIETLYRNYR